MSNLSVEIFYYIDNPLDSTFTLEDHYRLLVLSANRLNKLRNRGLNNVTQAKNGKYS